MWLIDKAGEPWPRPGSGSMRAPPPLPRTSSTAPDHAAHYRRTGTGVNACQMSVQLTWMTRNRPDVLARATTGFHCKDWLYFKLTGNRATDPSEANFTFGHYPNRTLRPGDPRRAGRRPMRKRLLPPIVEGTEVQHGLSPEAARLTRA